MFRTVNWFTVIIAAAAQQLKDDTFISIRWSFYIYRLTLLLVRLLRTSLKMDIVGRSM